MAYVPFFFYQDGLSRSCLLPTVFPSVLAPVTSVHEPHKREFVCESRLLLSEELTWYISHCVCCLNYSFKVRDRVTEQFGLERIF